MFDAALHHMSEAKDHRRRKGVGPGLAYLFQNRSGGSVRARRIGAVAPAPQLDGATNKVKVMFRPRVPVLIDITPAARSAAERRQPMKQNSRRRSGEADAIDKFLVALGLEFSKKNCKKSFLSFNRVSSRSLGAFGHERTVRETTTAARKFKTLHNPAHARAVFARALLVHPPSSLVVGHE